MEERPHRVKPGLMPGQRPEDEAIHARYRRATGLAELVAMGEMTPEQAEEIRRAKACGPPDRLSRAIISALRAERECQGLSLVDVAERTGFDRTAVHRLEIGLGKSPTVDILERYAAALGKRITMAFEDLTHTR